MNDRTRQKIHDNIKRKAAAEAALKAHPMVQQLRPDGKRKLIVVFPFESQGLGGLRVDNTAAGMEMALERCEAAWIASYPNPERWAAKP